MIKFLKKYWFPIIGFILTTTILYKKFYNKSSNKQVDNHWDVVVSPDYKPFCYLNNQQVDGLDLEILKEIGIDNHKQLVIKIVGFNFLFTEIQQNKSHIGAGGITITEERKNYNIISDSYLPLICGILIKKNLILNKDFKGKIGLQTGSVFKKIIENKFPQAQIVEIEDFLFILEDFKQNKLDMVVSDLIVLLDLKDDDNLLFQLKTEYENLGTGFLLNKNIDLKKFNESLKKVASKNKKIRELKEKVKNIPFFP
jgi:glutamine transport system substrate-binding protein